MGLSSSVIHVRTTDRNAVIAAIGGSVASAGFVPSGSLPVSSAGPSALADDHSVGTAGPYYLVSAPNGQWIAVIEAHSFVRQAPKLVDLSLTLSQQLTTHSIALAIHDGDVFHYQLHHAGQPLDSYDSCPQYFADIRLPDEYVESVRHAPDSFRTLVADDDTIDQLSSLLDDGWWEAYDSGELDSNGVPEDGVSVDEFDRMTTFGSLLRLYGNGDGYPLTAWAQAEGIAWADFTALRYKSSQPSK